MRVRRTTALSMAGPAATVAAIAASALIWHNLPTTTDIYAPFDVHGAPGEQVQGRNLTATISGARIAAKVTADSVLTRAPVAAVGQWIVVDAEMSGTTAPAVPRAELIAGPNTYRPTDRLPAGTTLGGPLQPSIDERGAWVFDVPPALLESGDTVVLRIWDGDGRLDSLLSIALPLDDPRVSRMDTAAVARPVRAVS